MEVVSGLKFYLVICFIVVLSFLSGLMKVMLTQYASHFGYSNKRRKRSTKSKREAVSPETVLAIKAVAQHWCDPHVQDRDLSTAREALSPLLFDLRKFLKVGMVIRNIHLVQGSNSYIHVSPSTDHIVMAPVDSLGLIGMVQTVEMIRHVDSYSLRIEEKTLVIEFGIVRV